ncbi:MAG: hypothetical protein M9932_19460 [Xanthobacteraceae bacterium]|nr:hypothetical protein [Xanthobacteraceae bacterium]
MAGAVVTDGEAGVAVGVAIAGVAIAGGVIVVCGAAGVPSVVAEGVTDWALSGCGVMANADSSASANAGALVARGRQ